MWCNIKPCNSVISYLSISFLFNYLIHYLHSLIQRKEDIKKQKPLQTDCITAMEQDTYSVRPSIVLENIKNVAIYMIQLNFA